MRVLSSNSNIIYWSSDPTVSRKFLYLSSISGLVVGDTIEIMLDSGVLFKTTIVSITPPNKITIASPLPTQASAGNIVIDITQNTIVAASRAELSTDLGG